MKCFVYAMTQYICTIYILVFCIGNLYYSWWLTSSKATFLSFESHKGCNNKILPYSYLIIACLASNRRCLIIHTQLLFRLNDTCPIVLILFHFKGAYFHKSLQSTFSIDECGNGNEKRLRFFKGLANIHQLVSRWTNDWLIDWFISCIQGSLQVQL